MAQVNGNIPPASGLGPQTAGVWGDSRDQYGVVGTSHARNGVRGISDRRAGVFGVGDIRPGVSGTSENDRGVYGTGGKVGVHGFCETRVLIEGDPTVFAGVFGEGADYGVHARGGIGLVAMTTENREAAIFRGDVYVDGRFTVANPANKHASVSHPDGTHRALCCLECPESWFEDFGRAELKDGRTAVAIDADFAALVETDDYHVFLTPEGQSNGLYVSARTSKTFEVREQADGRSTLSFSYRIVARPKDIEHERLAVLKIPVLPELKAPELEQLDDERTD